MSTAIAHAERNSSSATRRAARLHRPVGWLAIALLLLAPALAAGAAEVVDVRLGRHAEFTRIVFELDARAGYRLVRKADEAGGEDVFVYVDAGSNETETLRVGKSPLERVDVKPRDGDTVARIQVNEPGLVVKEMILSKPPRIVLDVVHPAAVASAAAKTVAAPAPPKPAPAASLKPTTSVAAQPAASKAAQPAAPKAAQPTAAPEDTPEARPTQLAAAPKPAAPPVSPPAVAPAPAARPSPSPVAPPATVPVSKPASPAGPPAASRTGPPGAAAADAPDAPTRDMARTSPAPPTPARPAARPAPVPPPARAVQPAAGESGISWSTIGVALAGVGVALIVIFVWLRRRGAAQADEMMEEFQSEPTESDDPFAGLRSAPEATRSDDATEIVPPPASADDEPSLFADDSTPTAAPGREEQKEADMDVHSDTEAPTVANLGAPPMAEAGGDVAQLMRELERRLAHMESRLDEEVDARERLERQVAAQTEELRVQRAAIARTQRALRNMTRPEDEAATEPAPREQG